MFENSVTLYAKDFPRPLINFQTIFSQCKGIRGVICCSPSGPPGRHAKDKSSLSTSCTSFFRGWKVRAGGSEKFLRVTTTPDSGHWSERKVVGKYTYLPTYRHLGHQRVKVCTALHWNSLVRSLDESAPKYQRYHRACLLTSLFTALHPSSTCAH